MMELTKEELDLMRNNILEQLKYDTNMDALELLLDFWKVDVSPLKNFKYSDAKREFDSIRFSFLIEGISVSTQLPIDVYELSDSEIYKLNGIIEMFPYTKRENDDEKLTDVLVAALNNIRGIDSTGIKR